MLKGTRLIAQGVLLTAILLMPAAMAQTPFRIEESTIEGVHAAIRSGQTSCRRVVQAYIDRAKAYNGNCTSLVTADGSPVPAVTGPVRAGAPLKFPTITVPVSSVFPNFKEYTGPTLEFGRMEPTISDPSVQQQFGMRVGVPNAGQLNALEVLNIRGERSATCKGDFDRHPSAGPLPAGAPAVCEEFRKQPDALERAAELDKQYGNKPDLDSLPLYCTVISIKNWYDAKDMRSTGGNDVNFAMDAPTVDSPDVAEMRKKGAIIYAVATANNVGGYGGAGVKAKSILPDGNLAYGLWGGQPCNPYDTERVPRGTSGGSGVSVGANLAACSICEQSSASCKGPASRNNVVNLLTTKGVIMDGGITSKHSGDRAGIHCRTVKDAVTVLDGIKGYESDDMFTSIPKALIPKEPYASFLVADKEVPAKPLKGMRIAIAREFMVKHTKNDEAISDQIDKEIKSVLRDRLGADLVESVDPLYKDDPTVPNMKYTFQQAFAEILPHNVPEYFFQKTPSGELEFAVPGWDVTTVDYLVALATGKAPLSDKLTLRRIALRLGNPRSPFIINTYLAERGDTRVKDWASWVPNAKFESEADKIGAQNSIAARDPRAAADSVSYLKMQAVLRMIILKVMYENKIDLFVNPEQTTPPYKLGYAGEPEINNRPTISCCTSFTALLGGPEMDVPAGYTQVAYDPQYVLSPDKKEYLMVTGTVETKLPHPMPISMMFWSAPGSDPDVIKAASAYESATHHRKPPPAFGPVATKATN
ncbi:MAG TPA: amidase family protein [Vicinamibacterales bacterium]|nr:amidase family protein [Vicinamibacterales bacterium]